MPFSKILYLVGFIVNFLPAFRFQKHKFFYYIFILGIVDPLAFLLIKFLHIDNTANIQISYMLILWSFPLIDFKIKTLLTVAVSISVYAFNSTANNLSLVIIDLTYLFIFLKNIEEFIFEQKNNGKGSAFLVILAFGALLDAVTGVFFIARISIFVQSYIFTSILAKIQYLLLLYLGAKSKFKIPFVKISNKIKLPSAVKGYNDQEVTKDHQLQYVSNDSGYSQLTERELQIMELICTGMTSKEIADKLFLSKKTIDYYRSSIKLKLNISKKSELINYFQNSISNKNG
jgi:DNA-binding CsgD family transcriptional regulator